MSKASARRLKGDGSIYQTADGTWVAALDMGYGPTGARRRWVGKARTQEAALAKLREARRELESNGSVASKSTTVGAWLDYWLDNIARPRIRPKTYLEYERCIRLHLKPRIGRISIARLTPTQVRDMERALATEHSAATANNVHRCLRTALNDALREGKATRNAAALITPPSVRHKARQPLTAAQASRVIAETSGTAMGARWAFALYTGTRQGEALGMEWDRLDLNEGVADIAWQLQRISYAHGCGGTCGRKRGGNCPKRMLDAPDDFEVRTLDSTGLVLTRPKTARSTRMIPLPAELVDALRAMRRDRIGGGLVWTRPDGRPIDPKDDAAAWDALLASLELPDVPLHSTRHTTASLLQAAGVDPKVIQDLLGHTSITTTQMYQHADLTLQRAAMNTLGAVLA